MSDFQKLKWYERQEDSWRLEIRCRYSRRKSILCGRITKGKHFWSRIKVDPKHGALQRCHFCKSVRFEPATIDIRGTAMTIEAARQMGRTWLDQMDANGNPMPRVRVYFNAVDGVESFMVWAREDELMEAQS